MRIDNKIRDENLQYYVNREAANKLDLSPRKVVTYEYLTGEEILPLDHRRVIEQAKVYLSSFRKGF